MWVMAKSALCIGIVSVLATSASGGGEMPSTLGAKGQDAAKRIIEACTASPDCLALGSRAVSAVDEPEGDVPAAVARVVLAASTNVMADPTAAVSLLPSRTVPVPPLPPARPLHWTFATRR